MGKQTLWGKIVGETIRKIEYYFAKRWLDRTFGPREWWGEVISDLLLAKSTEPRQSNQAQVTPEEREEKMRVAFRHARESFAGE